MPLHRACREVGAALVTRDARLASGSGHVALIELFDPQDGESEDSRVFIGDGGPGWT